MPRRVIIHAGFHKTGTSTLQATLRTNRTTLKRQVALRLRWHLKDVIAASRAYSTDNDPLTLVKVQSRFGTMVNELPGMPRRTLVISAEELAGHLPGRGPLKDYAAAPVLIYAYWEIAKARFPQSEILIYLSTRDPEAWLASAYWEHVKSSNMALTFETFKDRYRSAADLDAMVAEITARVPAPVYAYRLEDTQNLPLGPADPLLDLCHLPAEVRTELVPVPPQNRQLGPEVLAALLEANRIHKTPAARNAAKKRILSEVRDA